MIAEQWLMPREAAPARAEELKSCSKRRSQRRNSISCSLRRSRETVGDLDFLVASSDPAPIMAWFVGYPGVKEVTAHGETKSSVRFESGLQADLEAAATTLQVAIQKGRAS